MTKAVSNANWTFPDEKLDENGIGISHMSERRAYVRGYNKAIEDAVEWLRLNLKHYAGEDSFENSVPFNKEIFDDFLDYMAE